MADKQRESRHWVILVGSLLFGLAIVPGTLTFLIARQSPARFYHVLLGGDLQAWLIVCAPFFLVQCAWALRRMSRSNSGQKKLLVGAAALLLLTVFLPPWQASWSGGGKFLGYSPVVMEPPTNLTDSAAYRLEMLNKPESEKILSSDPDWVPVPGVVAWRILGSQLVVLAILTVAIHYMLGPSTD